MFDFEKLDVYVKAKTFNKYIITFIEQNNGINAITIDQLRRASFSIMLNIAEGSGRFTKRDKRNFYVISRGSVFECVAILDYLHDTKQLDQVNFKRLYSLLEELSKMLYGLIKGLSVKEN